MKKTALTFSLLLSLGAVVLSGCNYKKKTDSRKQVALFTIADESYTADDLFGLTDKKTSYNFLATEDGVNHAFESVYGSLAKKYVERDGVMDEAVKDLMEDFDEEVESYANSNQVTVRNARKTKLEELGLEDLDALKEQYYVEKQISQLESMYEDDMFEIKKTDNDASYKSSLLYKYIENTNPMVVRHVLSSVSDSATIYTKGKMTEDEVTNFTTILQRFALMNSTTNTFKNIALEESGDTGSKSKGGRLGIVDTYEAFVAPFKLGLFLTEYDQADADKQAAVAAAYGIDTEKVDTIKEINIVELAIVMDYVKEDLAKTLQTAKDHKTESEYDESLYPRNQLYNEVLNDQTAKYMVVDKPTEDGIKSLLRKAYPNTLYTSDYSTMIDAKYTEAIATELYTTLNTGLANLTEETYVKENNKNITFVKSEHGFHFITVDYSTAINGVEDAYKYFSYGENACTDNDYVSYVNTKDTTGYSSSDIAVTSRQTEIYDSVYNYLKGGFESNSKNDSLYEYEVYEYFMNKVNDANFIANANVKKAIDEKIQLAKVLNTEAIEEAKENTWESYYETIEAYKYMYAKLYSK